MLHATRVDVDLGQVFRNLVEPGGDLRAPFDIGALARFRQLHRFDLCGESSLFFAEQIRGDLVAGQIFRDPEKKGSATTYLLTAEYESKRRSGDK